MRVADVMANRLLYRVWQAPFAEEKIAPVLAHTDLKRVRRVLDVGCGPGTNAQHFENCDYLGVDLSASYIADARRRHRGTFVCADAVSYEPDGAPFDFILINSLLHHLDTPSVERLLARLATLLSDDGAIHILELEMPERASVARQLARWDRGHFARPLEAWRQLFGRDFALEIFQPYRLRALGVTLWNMIYFKGGCKR